MAKVNAILNNRVTAPLQNGDVSLDFSYGDNNQTATIIGEFLAEFKCTKTEADAIGYIDEWIRTETPLRKMPCDLDFPKIGRIPGKLDLGRHAALRCSLDRFRSGKPLEYDGPVFRVMSREERVKLDLYHAELHLSFLHPERRATPGAIPTKSKPADWQEVSRPRASRIGSPVTMPANRYRTRPVDQALRGLGLESCRVGMGPASWGSNGPM